MRILYGVVGEGMGHATRSRVVIEHLLQQGHEVQIVVSGRAHDMLQKHFAHVHKIHGLHMVYEDNEIKKTRTFFSNVSETFFPDSWREGLPGNIRQYFSLLEKEMPDVVISDFESFSYWFGRAHGLPIISIDNMQIIARCRHDDDVFDADPAAFLLAKGIVKAKLPGCRRYFVSTFFYPPVKKDRTTLVPPILRPEVLAATPSHGEHVLVYQSGEGAESVETALKAFPEQTFLVYGMRRGIAGEETDDNLRHQPFSETKFVEHLASAKAVIAGGGFSLLSEAVYLRKPVLSVPLEGQFEQTLNALYLEKLGYGLHRKEIRAADVEELLLRAPAFSRALQDYQQDGNRTLFALLDAELASIPL